MQKRHFLAALAALPLVSVTACGFRLRGAADYAFDSLYLQAPEGSALGRELLRLLAASSQQLRLVLPPTPASQAAVTLHLHGEDYSQAVLAKTVAGQVRELQLRLQARLSLIGQDGRIWMPEATITQQRDMTYSETLALAKDDEVAGLITDMRHDIAQQVLRRLALLQAPAS